MRVVYFGWDEFAVPSLIKLSRGEHEVLSVVTLPDAAMPDGSLLRSPVAEYAEQNEIPMHRYQNANHPELVGHLGRLDADIGVVAASFQTFSASLRQIFKQGCIGMHPSLLPKFRGPAPIARVMLRGETRTGVSVYRLTEKPDAGPLLIQRETMIRPGEVWLGLHHRLARIACDAIGAALLLLEQDPGFEGIPQKESEATWAPVVEEKEGHLNFQEPAWLLAAKCRAMWPFPGTVCRFLGRNDYSQIIRIVNASAIEKKNDTAPGMITDDFLVGTGKGLLEIHALELPDESLMSWMDFVEENHVAPGDRFGSVP